jgi:hypothetical protein
VGISPDPYGSEAQIEGYNQLGEEMDDLTPAQETSLQTLNDTWGVSKWERDTAEPQAVLVTMDDGDLAILYPDGEYVWDFSS